MIANRPFTTSTRALLTAQFDRVVAGTSIMIPRELIELLPKMNRKKVGQDIIALVYYFIENELDRCERKQVSIHHKKFDEISSSRNVIKRAKDHLIEHGFLRVGRKYRPNVSSKKHRLLKRSNKEEYILKVRNSNDALFSYTQPDEDRCLQTRNNLNQIEVNINEARSIFQNLLFGHLNIPREILLTKGEKKLLYKGKKLEEITDRKDTGLAGLITPLRNLIYQKGKVHRSDKGRRLYSPLTQIKSEFRQCITVDGESLVSVDMTACQPTLLSMMSGDKGAV